MEIINCFYYLFIIYLIFTISFIRLITNCIIYQSVKYFFNNGKIITITPNHNNYVLFIKFILNTILIQLYHYIILLCNTKIGQCIYSLFAKLNYYYLLFWKKVLQCVLNIFYNRIENTIKNTIDKNAIGNKSKKLLERKILNTNHDIDDFLSSL